MNLEFENEKYLIQYGERKYMADFKIWNFLNPKGFLDF